MTAKPALPLPPLDAPLTRTRGAPPLQRQLLRRLRDAMLEGALPAGSLLPGTRALADALGVSRNTVTAVYEQLVAEGFLRSDRLGTRVVDLVRPARAKKAVAAPKVARRIADLRPAAPVHDGGHFRPGVPALAQFPAAAWRHALDRAGRRSGAGAFGYGDPFGEPVLRAAIARHLAVTRGVHCEPARIVITDGAQGAIALCVQLLTDPGDVAWIEEPGYRGARAAMRAGDLEVVPVRVDAEGLRVEAGDWRGRPPRIVYTTPSNQYPTGAVLSVARRLALLDAAQRHGAWVIEDDYDSEFRHAGEPIGAMQGLVANAPVLYVGSFSKTMLPALRLGFVVLPEALVPVVADALGELLRGVPRHTQLALADFIESGEYARHLGRMRRLYRGRRRALLEALGRFDVAHRVEGGPCGLHLTLRLPGRCPDRALAAAASAHGIGAAALSAFAMRPVPSDNGLVLGYGNTPEHLYEPLVRRLAGLARGIERG
ncbi:PLP-dependent aminotransferase family protein [[Pseudomonas] boreopolis]|uniref:MocR-like pyridoxine biosynthesis transcription factor PdxR n=1 Tax=Xanthomonas boreopolis TaxID=86183 RepID=UPI003D9BF8A8